MAATTVKPPFDLFTDVDGKPLENGFVYIGVAGLDAEANPKSTFLDKELTVPAASPARTLNGYVVNNGTPAVLFVGDDYSITVRNKNGTLVFSSLSADVLGLAADLSQAYEFPTLNDAITSTIDFPVGKTMHVKERTVGNGGGDQWSLVTKGTTPGVNLPDGNKIVQHDTSTLVLVRSDREEVLLDAANGYSTLKGFSADIIGLDIAGFDAYLVQDTGIQWAIASAPASGTISAINTVAGTTTIGGTAYKIFNTANFTDLGRTQGVLLNAATVLLGSQGVEQVADPAPTRTAWDAKVDNPTPGTNSLNMAGNWIAPDGNGMSMFGGSTAYFSYATATADLAFMNAGDNSNTHLAGVILGYHCDLSEGSHGGIFGGSFKQIKGDYGFSVGGTMHQVYALDSGIVGGRHNSIGDAGDLIAARRCVIVGGEFGDIPAGEQSAIIAGDVNKVSANNAVIIGGTQNVIEVGANDSTATGAGVVVDIPRVDVYSNAVFAAKGDNQVYDMGVQRDVTANTTAVLSRNGGSSGDIYAPDANSLVVIDFIVSVMRTDVLGETAIFKVNAAYTNVSGALVMVGSDITTIFNSSTYSVAASVRGGGTTCALVVTAPGAVDMRCSAFGKMTVQKIIP